MLSSAHILHRHWFVTNTYTYVSNPNSSETTANIPERSLLHFPVNSDFPPKNPSDLPAGLFLRLELHISRAIQCVLLHKASHSQHDALRLTHILPASWTYVLLLTGTSLEKCTTVYAGL